MAGNIILTLVFPIISSILFLHILSPKEKTTTERVFVYLLVKVASVFLFISSLSLFSFQNASDALKTLINPERTITMTGQVIDQCDSLQCRVGGTDADFRLEDGTEVVVKCRFWCGLKNDGYYEVVVTPDEYLMLEAKEL